ncbi:MAG: protocatechuate 3,4-dioxygenase subunit alpha [Roseovarius sp.]
MADMKESPSQTAGPYVHIGCVPGHAGLDGIYRDGDLGASMITGAPDGEHLTLTLRILDGEAEPVRDALVEIWQPGPDGSFGPTEGFSHWGRQPAHPETGDITFETLMPGSPKGQAPHILVWIAARGINLALMTRIYFPGQDNDADPIFTLAGDRAETMLARPRAGGFGHVIHLQGNKETVFLDV